MAVNPPINLLLFSVVILGAKLNICESEPVILAPVTLKDGDIFVSEKVVEINTLL